MQQLPPPRIAAVHDLSCVGRCALTVIIPTLSVMGYQTVPVPTALLSSHTGGFSDLYFRDLTADMPFIADHFERLELSFRSIYIGFLGSEEQIETVQSFIQRFGHRPDESGELPVVLVDPVMGDDGVLYSTYTPALVEGICRLSQCAQILTPNLTEACLLLHEPYVDTATLSVEQAKIYADGLLERMCEVYPADRIVITGISLQNGAVANAGCERKNASFWIERSHCGTSYPGTGDIFASVLLGTVLSGADFASACARAADFVGELISDSAQIATPTRMGVALESHLWKLTPGHEIKKEMRYQECQTVVLPESSEK
ncbi:MAG: pyridoxamine kinase [Clostridia bacterium]|nr:pyridoxamine kinase [Clostridia bacterium]